MSESSKPIAVVVVEDLREVREWLAEIVGGDGADVIVTDLGLPDMSGTEGIRILRERLPDVPILAFTIYDAAAEVFGALCAGWPVVARRWRPRSRAAS